MKITKTKAIIIAVLSVFMTFVVVQPDVQSRTKHYYSGDAITYRNNLVFGTVNTGAMELFTLENNKIVRTATFKPKFERLPKGSDGYYDLHFQIEGGELYLYLVNGAYMFKYNISNLYSPRLVENLRDNSWDWFMQIDSTSDYLVTIGDKQIKFWNDDLEVVHSFKSDFERADKVSVSDDSKYIFSFAGNYLKIFSTEKREYVGEIRFVSMDETSNRGFYYDSYSEEIYLADDSALKVFGLDGRELRRFAHTSDRGYDVAKSRVSNAVYFSDGIGVVKNDRNTFKPIDWAYTTTIGSVINTWAMDLAVVSNSNGDLVVVFNNNEILVMDGDLELIDYFKASEVDLAPIEDLYLNIDKKYVLPGDYLTVSGGGFEAGEELKIKMGDGFKDYWTTKADANGRFKKTITVIKSNPKFVDIKVDGLSSKLTYSINVKIESLAEGK